MVDTCLSDTNATLPFVEYFCVPVTRVLPVDKMPQVAECSLGCFVPPSPDLHFNELHDTHANQGPITKLSCSLKLDEGLIYTTLLSVGVISFRLAPFMKRTNSEL